MVMMNERSEKREKGEGIRPQMPSPTDWKEEREENWWRHQGGRIFSFFLSLWSFSFSARAKRKNDRKVRTMVAPHETVGGTYRQPRPVSSFARAKEGRGRRKRRKQERYHGHGHLWNKVQDRDSCQIAWFLTSFSTLLSSLFFFLREREEERREEWMVKSILAVMFWAGEVHILKRERLRPRTPLRIETSPSDTVLRLGSHRI